MLICVLISKKLTGPKASQEENKMRLYEATFKLAWENHSLVRNSMKSFLPVQEKISVRMIRLMTCLEAYVSELRVSRNGTVPRYGKYWQKAWDQKIPGDYGCRCLVERLHQVWWGDGKNRRHAPCSGAPSQFSFFPGRMSTPENLYVLYFRHTITGWRKLKAYR